MTRRLTLVDITDEDEDDITVTLTRQDAEDGARFWRGVLYGTATSITIWAAVGVLIWAVWPR